jgi:uncharacterized delta-60 repeat protein
VKRDIAFFQAALLTTLLFLSRLIGQAADGNVDTSFNPAPYNAPDSIAIQPDGKILIGGSFTSVGGTNRNGVARLNADGTVDGSFKDPNFNVYLVNLAAPNEVYCIAPQADGKIVTGGQFTSVGGVPRNCIARLNADGSVDGSFNPNASTNVQCIALQANGAILIGGSFTNVGGMQRNYIARLNTNGTVDNSFNPNASGGVASVGLQADGKILIGGNFTSVGGTSHNYIVRLNADGTVDGGFSATANSVVECIAVQADGKILIGGVFTSVDGTARRGLARLNTDGTFDSSFNPSFNSSYGCVVYSAAVQADGRILVGGMFEMAGSAQNYMVRLNVDGSVDNSFNPNVDYTVRGIAMQADGEILIGGNFGNVGGTQRDGMARLLNAVASQTLSVPDSTQVQWLRSGTAPELGQVAFELSADGGSTWTALGNATRVNGGWGLTGLSLPLSGYIRARGRTVGGVFDGSSGLIEQVASFSVPDTLPPVLTCPPDVTVYTDPGQCHASGVALGTPTATDNSGSVTVTSNAPALFPLGTNTVTWTATDPSSNSTTCSQQVIVLESVPPSVTCPSRIAVPATSLAGAVVFYPVTPNGGCPPATVVCVPPSGSTFPIGSTLVTARVTDACGLVASNSFTVTVSLMLNSSAVDGGRILSWPFGVLQASDRVDGTYTNVPNAVSPFTITPTGPEQYYYRVKVQ